MNDQKNFFNKLFFLFFLASFFLGFLFLTPQKVYACDLVKIFSIMCTCPIGCIGCNSSCEPGNCYGANQPGCCYTSTCNTSTGCWTESWYKNCVPEDACCVGCFTGETAISVGESENPENSETKQIKDIKPGDVVESFDPETGEVKEGMVSNITELTREGYYLLETKSGKKVKVTAEHPFLAVKSEENQASINQVSNFKDQLENFLSYTLTYRLITGFQAKVSEILR